MRDVLIAIIALCVFVNTAKAQNEITITGNVKNKETNDNISSVSVMVKDGRDGTFSNEKGNFKIITSHTLPLTLIISSVGYDSTSIGVADESPVTVVLTPSVGVISDVVVGATRRPVRYIEAPVTIERVTSKQLVNEPGASYYDAISHLKGVDITTSGYLFKTISTRGFNGSGNLRFNQLVDGMDNNSPALNFSVGNIVGVSENDVESMELLQGASSALYGSGGMNGTLLINSKDPFKYQGVSVQVKEGVTHVGDSRQSAAMFHNISFRWAQKLSEKFAFKIGAEFIKTDDWQADDSTDLLRNNIYSQIIPGNRATDPTYDGVNIYGDEVAGLFPIQLDPTAPLVFVPASRTGYEEKYIVDYNTYNVKVNGGLYYKINQNTEASLTANWGAGTIITTGADRYSLKNFKIGQYKAEVKSKNWFLRAYTTQENSGDSYASTFAAISVNESWKSTTDWLGAYIPVYLGAVGGGASSAEAANIARNAADQGRFLPNTPEFNNALNQVISTPINQGGAQFLDKSSMYQGEGQIDLTQYIKAINVIVGASYKMYHLNSDNTLFDEENGPINVSEVGTYLQLQKSLLNDVLTLTASGRFDKNKNFKGRFTPRFTASVKIAKDNFIRLSYQQAYRFPSNQDQYISLQTPGSKLLGGLPYVNEKYNFDGNPAYTAESVVAFRESYYNNPTAPDDGLLKPAPFAVIKPESMQSFEIGYRGVIAKKLIIDAYYYYARYKDFIGRTAVARGDTTDPLAAIPLLLDPSRTNNYSFATNSPVPVKENGWGIGLEYRLVKNYSLTANVYSDVLSNVPSNVVTFFNTPKVRFNVGFGNSNVYKGFGFNVNYKWQDKVFWEGTFGTGNIPSFGVLDGEISYQLSSIKSLVKLGGTNLFNHYYRNSFGNPYVGGLYYISFGYNIF